MKILALTRYSRLGASSRLRFLQYIPYLNSHNIKVDVSYLLSSSYVESIQDGAREWREVWKGYIRRIFCLINTANYDLIWIEKDCLPWIPVGIEKVFLDSRIPVVIDYDDAVFHLYDRHHNPILRRLLSNKHPYLMKNAALVIVGNQYLEDFAKSNGAARVAQLPTSVDLSRYVVNERLSAVRNAEPLRIGWIGQNSTVKYLKPFLPIFNRISQEENVRFIAIGVNFSARDLEMERIAWRENSEVCDLQALDIGVMPLTDGLFERGKCGYKILQYMACSIPVVASPVGENKRIVDNTVSGFLADTEAEWIHALRTLIREPLLRKRMGELGRKKVERSYSLEVIAPRLLDLLKTSAYSSKD